MIKCMPTIVCDPLKKYPYGVFCPCGLTIHIKGDEVKIGYNDIQCPKCGFVAGLIVNGKNLSIENLTKGE